uniref:TLC domain-containing protein n=1 Tax=Heterorhabditis bacteriophora TaxID=37862 RepID=A0A1I7WUN9_HETBA
MSGNRNSLDDIKNNNEAEKANILHCRYCGRVEIQKENTEKKAKKINNGIYLSIIIGNSIDLTMNSTERPIDAICHFLMVWYYCTLTIRESILIINGSKIHWWWVAHHYLACVVGGVALTWPDDLAYRVIFSYIFLVFSEGFATWMFQGLTFLLPFLMVAYLYEIYNAFTLYRIWTTQECVWQVFNGNYKNDRRLPNLSSPSFSRREIDGCKNAFK